MSKTRIRIVQDENPENPRTAWDCNAATFAFFHKRYTLGDKDHGLRFEDFDGWGEMEAHIVKTFKPAYITPVYMYDHSGITISSSPFSCPWDSGRIGFAWITREKLAECAGPFKRLTAELKKLAERNVESELQIYDQYLTGDLWGFVVEEQCGECDEWHETDSCWGFYGGDIDKNGMRDHIGDLIDAGAEVIKQ